MHGTRHRPQWAWIPGIAALLTLLPMTAAHADVVVNEIFYNAPEDRDEIQWIELHNTGASAVDVGNWQLDEGKSFVIPAGTRIPGRGYLVVALDPGPFTETYRVPALGPLKRPLKRGGERIELRDARGNSVDVARYKDREPWPVSADGYSASLERICPTSPGEAPENWAASPMPRSVPRPAGTPGKQNRSYSAVLPPVISAVTAAPEELLPGRPLTVEAEVKGTKQPREVTLRYRVVAAGTEGRETAIPMTRGEAGRFRASIPGQAAGTLVRYRVRVVGEGGARRHYPEENDLRPTLPAYVHEPWRPARIPFGLVVRGGADRPGPQSPEAPEEPSAGRPSYFFGPSDRPAGFRGLPPGFDGPVGGFFIGFFGPWGFYGFRDDGPPTPRSPRGGSAFIYRDPKSGKTVVFDHIHAVSRSRGPMYRGFKLFFHKDRPLGGMSAVNLILEGSESFLMAEALAFDLYRRAGSPAPMTEFVRLWVDGTLTGYHLMVERPNRSFLRRNRRNDEGNLYKLLWYGEGLIEQHDKKTNERGGHNDLLTLIDRLHNTSGDEQWKLIESSFNVDQAATYFAVNMVLSHWDGFFNNYFAYHDTQGTKKWEIYPWDQDKAWGYHDGLTAEETFFDMPLTFGMSGAVPPPVKDGEPSWGGFGRFGVGPMWWRPPGHFSGPLLANPRFRRIFLARVREIVERAYTPEIYFPLIDDMADRLREDIILRARARGEDADAGKLSLTRNVELMKTHLLKRRQYLLAQPELRSQDQAGAR